MKTRIDKNYNKKYYYKQMAKCRLCGETFDAFHGNNKLIMTQREADLEMFACTNHHNKLIMRDTYIHYHKNGSYGIGDFAGLEYVGEVEDDK